MLKYDHSTWVHLDSPAAVLAKQFLIQKLNGPTLFSVCLHRHMQRDDVTILHFEVEKLLAIDAKS